MPRATRVLRGSRLTHLSRRLFALRVRAKRALRTDLGRWLLLGRQRRMLAEAAAASTQGDESVEALWLSRAAAESLPIDQAGYARHLRSAKYIATHRLKRGQSPWSRTAAPIGPVASWAEYKREASMPSSNGAFCDVVSDSLSFPLTAAFAARIAGVDASTSGGRLTLLILGAEVGSELGGLAAKWGELVGLSHGLGARALTLLFVGPEVPRRLDGVSRHVSARSGDDILAVFARGLWHDVHPTLPPELARPQLALCFNSGLAEHAGSWLPTLRHLYWEARCPIACTSYHQPEAELDARTLSARLGVRSARLYCAPNPFASRLRHLDEIFPGRTYVANAFLSVARPYWKTGS